MFDWLFKPKCPCDAQAKAWIEYRLKWLSKQFPESAFSGAKKVVLPTREFFPDAFDGTDLAAEDLMDRVCLYMGVNRRAIRLRFVDKVTGMHLVNEAGLAVAEAAGTFSGGEGRVHKVEIDRTEFKNVEGLIGTMAHELAHVRLLGENRIDGNVFDNELLTDLTTVHFGLGIFLGNSPRDWMSGYTEWPDSRLKKPEYMNRPMYGWALALLAHHRGETKPKWPEHLGRHTRREFDLGARYLKKTRDTSYVPKTKSFLN